MQVQPRRIAEVRAIPQPGHVRRWCGLERWVPDPNKRPQQEMEELPTGGFKPKLGPGGKILYAKHALPWPETAVKVEIVDEPEPFDPNKNGGVPVQISPSTLAALEKDPRIAVRVLGGDGGDPADIVRAKAQAADLEEELQKAQREIASLHERMTAAREEEAAKQAGVIAKLREDLAQLQGQIAARKATR